jgi:hypothetical protein
LERFNKEEKNMKDHRWRSDRLFFGSLLIGVGVLLLLVQMDLFPRAVLWRYWPMILVGIGLVKLIGYGTGKERRDGFWFLVIGAWLQISMENLFDLSFRDSWPMLLVAWGISMIWEGMEQRIRTWCSQ